MAVIANGDAYSLSDVIQIAKLTSSAAVMAARGALENPAMFGDQMIAPEECVRRFIKFAILCPIPFPLVLHHVSEMTVRMATMTKKEKRSLMTCMDLVDLIDYVEARWGLK